MFVLLEIYFLKKVETVSFKMKKKKQTWNLKYLEWRYRLLFDFFSSSAVSSCFGWKHSDMACDIAAFKGW